LYARASVFVHICLDTQVARLRPRPLHLQEMVEMMSVLKVR